MTPFFEPSVYSCVTVQCNTRIKYISMTTKKQSVAAKKNIKKAQEKWKAMTTRQRALAQPEGRSRKKPGSTGKGKFYHIEVRPKSQFTSFRTHDVGEKGGLERVTGRRSSGSWATVAWLVSKDGAHMNDAAELVITDRKMQSVLKNIREPIEHVKGDIFQAKPRKNIAEKDKPTLAQKKARAANIKKAQQARKKSQKKGGDAISIL